MAENQIVKYVSNQMQVELTPELVKSCLIKGGGIPTNEEVALFMNLCAYRQLNPFKNECYPVKYGNAPLQIITNYEVFLNRADANRHYKGKKQGIIVEVDGQEVSREGKRLKKGEILLGGWCRVHRDDREDEYCEVDFAEYNKNQSTWKTMPCTMIVKVAVSQAMRQAFPDELSGLYSDAEPHEIIDITPLKSVPMPERKSQSQQQSKPQPQSQPTQPAEPGSESLAPEIMPCPTCGNPLGKDEEDAASVISWCNSKRGGVVQCRNCQKPQR